jgi:tRNA A37 N6-isopentenylltransferase MiaA
MEKIMTNNDEASQKEQKAYTLISYEDVAVFNYTLPGETETQSIERELTFIWEESIEKFIEEHGPDRPYKIHSFHHERAKKMFLDQIEDRTDDLIEEVEEEIANKMKFGFEFTGQLHNDD